jgi:hypothetical protein
VAVAVLGALNAAATWTSGRVAVGHYFVHGTLLVSSESTCRGYEDVPNSGVTLYDGAGRVLAFTTLSESTDETVTELPTTCGAYDFTFTYVPSRPFYSVEVGHRGRVTFPENQLHDALGLTLGGQ